MGKVLIIGAGGVGSVAAHKMAMNSHIFSEITLASRTKSKCDDIAQSVKERVGVDIQTRSTYLVIDLVRHRVRGCTCAPKLFMRQIQMTALQLLEMVERPMLLV